MTTLAERDTYMRGLFRYPIKWKIALGSIKFSSQHDYELLDADEVDLPAARNLNHLPYCFDPQSERLFFTLARPGGDEKALAAPFLYIGQRENSEQALSVPFERLDEFDDGVPLPPTYIFSPGRTGSTLLSRLLDAAGTSSISEPDIFSQFAALGPVGRKIMKKNAARLVIQSSVASLSRHGAAPFLKLRSQCTPHADLIVSAVAGSRAVFMFRHVDAWALSRKLHFSESPGVLANMLKENIMMLDRLARQDDAPIVISYERLVAAPLAELAKMCPRLDLDDQALVGAVRAAQAKDSQAGSSLNRDDRPRNGPPPEFLENFHKEWRAIQPGGLIEKYGLHDIFRG